MKLYLFILCPPYCGSTLIWKLLSTSVNVSSLPSEGQFLPETKEIMRNNSWDDSNEMPWEKIKKIWDGYWNYEKEILVEKSPPNLLRTSAIEKYFQPVFFIIMVRNPYAHCEGLIRRNNWDAFRAANFSIRCLRQQAENVKHHCNALNFSYEQLVFDPESICTKIQEAIPQIGKLKHTDKFKLRSIDGITERGILDFNKKKINNLSIKELYQINTVFNRNRDILRFWGYEMYQPSLRHAVNYLLTKNTFFLNQAKNKASRLFNRASRQILKN